MYLLMRIGCIECGVNSSVVGVFGSKTEADQLASGLNDSRKARWLENGQNRYEVFEMPAGEFITEGYVDMIEKAEGEV